MYTRTSLELHALFKQAAASSVPNVKDAAIIVPGGRWLLVPTNNDHGGHMYAFDLSTAADQVAKPCILFETQNCDLSTMSFSGMQLDPASPTLSFTFAQAYRVHGDTEDPSESPWMLHVWRVQEVAGALHAECVHTMRLGSLDDSEARVVLYGGSLRDDMLAFSIKMESDGFSIVMVTNWNEAGDNDESYEGKIFPRIGNRQQLESLTLLSDSQILLCSTSGQLSTIHYASLDTTMYPEYDGSLLTEAETIHTHLSTSIDSYPKAQTSARSIDTTSPTFSFHNTASQRAIHCQ